MSVTTGVLGAGTCTGKDALENVGGADDREEDKTSRSNGTVVLLALFSLKAQKSLTHVSLANVKKRGICDLRKDRHHWKEFCEKSSSITGFSPTGKTTSERNSS